MEKTPFQNTEAEDWACLTAWQKFTIIADPWIYPVHRFFNDIPMKIAWMLPRAVARWAFIRVYVAVDPDPGPEYSYRMKLWEDQTKTMHPKVDVHGV
jgi:hypothetical protein